MKIFMSKSRYITTLCLWGLMTFFPVAAVADITQHGTTSRNYELSAIRNPLPPLLSAQDRALYIQIFNLQDKGKWTKADRLIRKLDNNILLGHVYYQRYMHPTKYRSRYSELSDWMLKYADHPGAKRIYDLAKKKNHNLSQSLHKPYPPRSLNFPANKPPLPGSEWNRTVAKAQKSEPDLSKLDPDTDIFSSPTLRSEERKAIAALEQRLKKYLRRGKVEKAEKRLWAFERQGLLSPLDFDRHLTKVANVYYLKGQDAKALALASLSAERSGDHISQSHWVSGLAAWRQNDCQQAAHHFSHVARSTTAGNWTVAAGAFWAARSHLVCQQPDKVYHWLKTAAQYPRTFYGLIANRQLAQSPRFNWQKPDFSDYHLDKIHDMPSIKRVRALSEIGRISDADRELKMTWSRTSGDKHDALLGLAAKLDLPNTQVIIGKIEEQKQRQPMDSVLYPVPALEPQGGYTLDRAMLLAFMRQESQFDSRARSYVGASGLMQLMPNTASYITADRSLRYGNKLKLEDPDYNIALGQQYLVKLLGDDYADGNLFLTATAYNAGPGNMLRWLKGTHFKNDPLLYTESIPARETRNYIERVLSNLWIYRIQLGQPTPSLDQVAAGVWPTYQALDGKVPTHTTTSSLSSPHNSDQLAIPDSHTTAQRTTHARKN